MPVLLAHLIIHAIDATTSRTTSLTGDPNNQRTVWDILWSCIMTIFACTWIAVHPNIPASADTRVMVALRRAGLMLFGLIAPEIIILWAMRQWYSARQIGQLHKGLFLAGSFPKGVFSCCLPLDKGWTTAHGFFLQMGGFMICDGKKAPYPIQLRELEIRYERKEVEWPQITEIEIQDKSKGDALSKTIVIVQTSWFLAQCVGRGLAGLVISELELVTLAFAALNAVTYFFWWSKPIDMRCPCMIYSKPQRGVTVHFNHATAETGAPALCLSTRWIKHWHLLVALLQNGLRAIILAFHATFSCPHDINIIGVIITLIYNVRRPAISLLKYLVRVVLSIHGSTLDATSRVPTFYAAQLDSTTRTFFLMSLACAFLGSVFGGIHCIGWSFQFVSRRDQILWCTSSIIITCAPLTIALMSNYMSRQRDRILVEFLNPALWDPGVTMNSESPEQSIHFDVTNDVTTHSLDALDQMVEALQYDPVYDKDILSLEPQQPNAMLSESEGHPGSPHHTTWNPDPVTPPRVMYPSRSNNSVHVHPQYYISSDLWSSWCYIFSELAWGAQCVMLMGITTAYTAARIMLVVQALMALKTLSPRALQAMEWTNFVPHF
jgi:hypothetical protein